jgi:hypothetical protein
MDFGFLDRILGPLRRFRGPRNYAQEAPELPDSRDPQLNIPKWDDPVIRANGLGYQLIRTQMGTAMPMRRLGVRISTLDLVAVGDVNSERRKAYQFIMDKSIGLSDMLQDIVWGLVEGVIFCQMFKAASPAGGPVFIVPNFLRGLSRKEAAGGPITWDGEKLYRVRRINPNVDHTDQHEAVLPRDKFFVWRPGAGSDPQGDPWIGLVMLDLAEQLGENKENTNAYRKRHGKIYHIIEKQMNRTKAADRGSILKSLVNRAFKQNAAGEDVTDQIPAIGDDKFNQFFGLPVGDALKLLEPSGATWQFLLDDRKEIKAEALQFIVGQLLTTDSRDSGGTGSSLVHLAGEDKFVAAPARSLQVPFNTDVRDWIDRNNPDIPKLLPGEEEIFYEFRSRGRRPEDIAELERLDNDEFANQADITSIGDALDGGVNDTGGALDDVTPAA